MNPTAADSTQPPPPRSSFSCDRHPGEKLSGFCSDCLCERLTTLDQSSSNNNPTTSSSVTGAIKSLFTKPSSSSSSYLRRTKSLSASKNDPFSSSAATAFEPQRKSSDARSRNTIISLDEQIQPHGSQNCHSKGIADTVTRKPVLEFIEAEESDDPDNNEYLILHTSASDIIEEITDLQEPPVGRSVKGGVNLEIVGKNRVKGNISKPMKDHIDLDSQMEKSSSRVAGGILSTAVLSKKWQKWRKKQKLKKKQDTAESSSSLSIEKPPVSMMKHIEIQPEMAEYGLGRRSCDSDPRFSLDVARISFDGPRYSLDEPRASLDGHLIGRTLPRMAPMVSVVEDGPVVAVPRSDTQIPVEDSSVMMKSTNDDAILPGGSTQTRDYYLDSSTRRRKSLDRSNSIRKTAAAVVAEIDDMKAASSAKALLRSDSVNRAKTLAFEKSSASYSNSLKDDCSETLELTGLKDTAERKGMKKSKKWAWNIFGFIYRRGGGSKDGDDDRCNRAEVSFSKDPAAGRDARGGLNRKLYRSNSSVSWRNSSTGLGSFEPARKSSAEMNGRGKEMMGDNIVLGRNLSGCYFSNRINNGLPVFT